MRTIRVAFCDFTATDKHESAQFILRALKKHYTVELSDSPEYVFFHESTHSHIRYRNAIKIFYTLENIHPDFNICDYAIAFDYMDFGDRYYRLPFYLVAPFYFASDEDKQEASNFLFQTQPRFSAADLAKKKGFCSFVYGNYLAHPERESFFHKLSQYKKVNSGGTFLNNVGGKVPSKLQFEKQHKFSITFENSSREGYTTEKIVNALAAKTIPIYWGNPKVGMEFNEKRFINCHAYNSMDEVIARIKEIDNDDALYLEMINQPITPPGHHYKDILYGFETFLTHIIDQPYEEARRIRINQARHSDIISNITVVDTYTKLCVITRSTLAWLYQPLKKVGFIEQLKRKYFLKKLR
jgi:hypothetical protein